MRVNGIIVPDALAHTLLTVTTPNPKGALDVGKYTNSDVDIVVKTPDGKTAKRNDLVTVN